MRKRTTFSVMVAVVLLILISESDARAARGGGARGGYRGGSRARSGSRASRSGSSGSSWRTLLLAGTLYGSARYMTRSRYRNNPDAEPKICENYVPKDTNGTVYGKFICPMWDQSDDKDHCCGPREEEHCCGYWDDPGRMSGSIVGIIVGVLACIGFILCIAKICCFGKKGSCSSRREAGCRFQNRCQNQPEASAKAQLPSGEVSDQPPAYGFKESDYKADYSSPESGPQPPSYDQVTKY